MRGNWRGFVGAWHERFVGGRILEWRNPYADLAPEEIPVHVMTGSQDWLMACWMLASWFHFTKRNWRVVIHDDGRLPYEAEPSFVKMLPGVRGITATHADRKVLEMLAGHKACLDTGWRTRWRARFSTCRC